MSRRAADLDCAQRSQTAAYVLGALGSEEAELYREHLHSCAPCREEIDELQPAADALPETAPRFAASEALVQKVMATVRSEAELLNAAGPQADRPAVKRSRRRTRRVALLAATLTMAAGIAVGALVVASGPSGDERVTTAHVAASAFGAQARLRQSSERAELVVAGMPQPPAGKVYQVWLARAHGAPQPTDALFSVTADGSGSVDVPGSLRGVKRLMVTAEPIGGSRHPTSAPVITATLLPS